MSFAHTRREPSVARRAIVAVAIAAAASVAVPANTASAQLGGLVKKARDKVVEQQVDKQIVKRTGAATTTSTDAAPTYDDVTLELTSDRLDGMIKGLAAGRAVLDGSHGASSRATLVARRDEAANKRADLATRNATMLNGYTEKRDASQRCRNEAMRASHDQRQQASQQRTQELQAKAMSDPAFRDKAMALSQKMAVAQQRGDTAELRRLAAELGLSADDAKADTAAADKACGREPALPAVLVQMDQLDAQAKEMTDEIRQLEEKAATMEVKESGLNERQFHMARERIEAYLSAMKYKSRPGAFSATELEALGAHRADLEKLM